MTEIILSVVIVALLGFMAWRDRQSSKVIEALSNKLMARDLPEYVRVSKDLGKKEIKQPQTERRKRAVDPVLGAQF